MADPVVYRSTHPDVLAHWEKTGSPDAQQTWRARVEQAIADLGFPGRRFATRDGMTGVAVTGIEHPADEPIPPGWRRDPGLSTAITPRRNVKAGKAAAAILDGLTHPNPRKGLPGGMPFVADAASECAFLRPAVQWLGDAVYVRWSQEISERDAARIDGAVWERVKLSAYYAAREASEQTGERTPR